jgi:hypothetical protein
VLHAVPGAGDTGAAPRGAADDDGVEELEDGWKITDITKFLSKEELESLRIKHHLNQMAEVLSSVSAPRDSGPVDVSRLPEPVRREIEQKQMTEPEPEWEMPYDERMQGDAPASTDGQQNVSPVTVDAQYILGNPGRTFKYTSL